jgi:hypothetical protein
MTEDQSSGEFALGEPEVRTLDAMIREHPLYAEIPLNAASCASSTAMECCEVVAAD